jgi:hypothetical protein
MEACVKFQLKNVKGMPAQAAAAPVLAHAEGEVERNASWLHSLKLRAGFNLQVRRFSRPDYSIAALGLRNWRATIFLWR